VVYPQVEGSVMMSAEDEVVSLGKPAFNRHALTAWSLAFGAQYGGYAVKKRTHVQLYQVVLVREFLQMCKTLRVFS
jgi:hypothetical protein